MVVILVHWQIRLGSEQKFIRYWKRLKLSPQAGFYREILTQVVRSGKDKLNTFNLSSPNYSTFINVGIWKNVKAFEEAVGQYIPEPKRASVEKNGKKKRVLQYTMEEFEFKIRERIVLRKIMDRERGLALPQADIFEK